MALSVEGCCHNAVSNRVGLDQEAISAPDDSGEKS
jgi:hypothetical protein